MVAWMRPVGSRASDFRLTADNDKECHYVSHWYSYRTYLDLNGEFKCELRVFWNCTTKTDTSKLIRWCSGRLFWPPIPINSLEVPRREWCLFRRHWTSLSASLSSINVSNLRTRQPRLHRETLQRRLTIVTLLDSCLLFFPFHITHFSLSCFMFTYIVQKSMNTHPYNVLIRNDGFYTILIPAQKQQKHTWKATLMLQHNSYSMRSLLLLWMPQTPRRWSTKASTLLFVLLWQTL